MTGPLDDSARVAVPTPLTATEAARNLSEVLSRVRYRDEEFEITRGGETVARLLPALAPRRVDVRHLFELLAGQERPDADFATLLREASSSPTDRS